MLKYAKVFTAVAMVGLSAYAKATVTCNAVPVTFIQSATSAGYHGMSAVGITGSTVFTKVSPSNCQAYGNDEVGNNPYLVLRNMGGNDAGVAEFWASMLLTAEVAGKTVTFSANVSGITSNGIQVLEPYMFKLD